MSASSTGSADCRSRIGDEVADRPEAVLHWNPPKADINDLVIPFGSQQNAAMDRFVLHPLGVCMARTIATTCFSVLATISASAYPADQLPTETLSSIEKTCPETPRQPTIIATGDLNRDTFPDVAAIVKGMMIACQLITFRSPRA